MLNPQLDLADLQGRWHQQRNLRIHDFLEAGVAQVLLHELRLQPHTLRVGEGPLAFLYGECTLVPEPQCDHPTCTFARWLHSAGRAWVQALTGMTLQSPTDGRVVATLYGKGCYLDPHNDFDGQRAVAYVLGLTPDSWPPEGGGHLEFLAVADGEVRVAERRPPGFNTLDLFDVSTGGPPHRIPIVTHHRERRALSGWFARMQ